MLERLKTLKENKEVEEFSIKYSKDTWHFYEKKDYNSGNITQYETLEELVEAELPEVIENEEDLL